MWIIMLVDQIKAGGIYLKGQRLDPPESIVEQFDEGSYEKSCAPWDINVPPEQLALRVAESKVKALSGEQDKVTSDLKKFRDKIAELEKHQRSLAKQSYAAASELDQAQKAAKSVADDAAAAKAAAEQQPAEPEQITEPVPPPCEDIGEAEMPKETKIDGPEKTEKQKPERKPPKKR